MEELNFNNYDVNLFRSAKPEFKVAEPGTYEFEVTKAERDDEKRRIKLVCSAIDSGGETSSTKVVMYYNLPFFDAEPDVKKNKNALNAWSILLRATGKEIPKRPQWDPDLRSWLSPAGEPITEDEALALDKARGDIVMPLVGSVWNNAEQLKGLRFFSEVTHSQAKDGSGKVFVNISQYALTTEEPTDKTIIREV